MDREIKIQKQEPRFLDNFKTDEILDDVNNFQNALEVQPDQIKNIKGHIYYLRQLYEYRGEVDDAMLLMDDINAVINDALKNKIKTNDINSLAMIGPLVRSAKTSDWDKRQYYNIPSLPIEGSSEKVISLFFDMYDEEGKTDKKRDLGFAKRQLIDLIDYMKVKGRADDLESLYKKLHTVNPVGDEEKKADQDTVMRDIIEVENMVENAIKDIKNSRGVFSSGALGIRKQELAKKEEGIKLEEQKEINKIRSSIASAK